MRRYGFYIFLLLLLFGNLPYALAQERNNLIATKRKLVLLIDVTSSKAGLDSIFKRAGISDADRPALLKGDLSVLEREGWRMVKHIDNIIEFDRRLSEIKENPPGNPFIITAQVIKNGARHGYLDDALYGVNKFSSPSVIELPSGLTRFILPGFLNSKRAFLSGSFNDWSTLKGLMTKTATGWMIDIKLVPGAYEYKFIADGRWMTDPANLIDLNDGAGNTNSAYFKYNYTFKLHGYPSAQKISVAGSFNNWNPGELQLVKNGNTWECPLYLHEGRHAYRFVIDDNWIADPANPDKLTDDKGNVNSVINIGQTVNFKLDGYTNARSVFLAGDFNDWQTNAIRLNKTADGWSTALVLASGNYNYTFIVDGKSIPDPANPYQSVVQNQTYSFVSVNANYKFKLKGYTDAKKVRLAVTFNNWNYLGYTLAPNGNEWSINLYLKPGKTLYKYIVDGNWIIDPGNKQWEQNDEQTGNSVLWIGQ